jgi:RNA polymerase sigma-70 factor (ECF subfamily)
LADDQDRAHVRRVRAGDIEAFEPIVRRWQGPLLNLAYRYCRNRGEAEEMVQEAFLRVYRKLHLYREEATFSTWMFSVAMRLFISHMRRRKPAGLPLEDFDRMPGGDPASLLVEQRDRDETVRRAVGTLPYRYQEAITLFYFLERDVEESARVLGVSTGTFKSRLHRGREMLRKKIGTLLAIRPAAAEA